MSDTNPLRDGLCFINQAIVEESHDFLVRAFDRIARAGFDSERKLNTVLALEHADRLATADNTNMLHFVAALRVAKHHAEIGYRKVLRQEREAARQERKRNYRRTKPGDRAQYGGGVKVSKAERLAGIRA
jgi:hypothetical protein